MAFLINTNVFLHNLKIAWFSVEFLEPKQAASHDVHALIEGNVSDVTEPNWDMLNVGNCSLDAWAYAVAFDLLIMECIHKMILS